MNPPFFDSGFYFESANPADVARGLSSLPSYTENFNFKQTPQDCGEHCFNLLNLVTPELFRWRLSLRQASNTHVTSAELFYFLQQKYPNVNFCVKTDNYRNLINRLPENSATLCILTPRDEQTGHAVLLIKDNTNMYLVDMQQNVKCLYNDSPMLDQIAKYLAKGTWREEVIYVACNTDCPEYSAPSTSIPSSEYVQSIPGSAKRKYLDTTTPLSRRKNDYNAKIRNTGFSLNSRLINGQIQGGTRKKQTRKKRVSRKKRTHRKARK